MTIEDIILEAYQDFKKQMEKKGYINIPDFEEKNLANFIKNNLRLKSTYI